MKRYMIALAVCIASLSGSALFAGVPGGPRVGNDIAPAGGSIEYTVTFRGGEIGRVMLSGDHDTDLDLYIYDSYGRLVAKDDDYSDVCVASWYAWQTQTFTIRVLNRGSVYNAFNLVTN